MKSLTGCWTSGLMSVIDVSISIGVSLYLKLSGPSNGIHSRRKIWIDFLDIFSVRFSLKIFAVKIYLKTRYLQNLDSGLIESKFIPIFYRHRLLFYWEFSFSHSSGTFCEKTICLNFSIFFFCKNIRILQWGLCSITWFF